MASPAGRRAGDVGRGAARALDAARAATFTQSYSTSLFALRDRARAGPGERVLVLGAGGGIGLAAIGVARALGCRVLGVASSADKRAAAVGGRCGGGRGPGGRAAQGSGARPGRAAPASTSWSTPSAGPWPSPSLRALGDEGRYLVIGFASGVIPSVPLNQVLLRNRSVIGIDWGIWAMQHPREQRGAARRDLLAMVVRRARSTRCTRPCTRSTTWPGRSRTCWAGGRWGRSRCCPDTS